MFEYEIRPDYKAEVPFGRSPQLGRCDSARERTQDISEATTNGPLFTTLSRTTLSFFVSQTAAAMVHTALAVLLPLAFTAATNALPVDPVSILKRALSSILISS